MHAAPRFFVVLSVAVVTCLTLLEPAVAGSGGLDPSFGDDGTKIVGFAGNRDFTVNGFALDPEGRPVLVGVVSGGPHEVIGIARFTVAGQTDTTFSGDGFATIDLSLPVEQTGGVTVQPDGRIVVSVRRARDDDSKQSFGLARLTEAGQLDQSFGDHGELLVPAKPTPQGEIKQLSGVGRPMVDAAGRILAPGSSLHGPSSAYEMFVIRSTPNGDLDATFGTNGIAWVWYGHFGVDAGQSLAPGGNGRVLLAGSIADYRSGILRHDGALVRLRPNGTLDPSFGSGGKLRVHGLFLNDVVRMPSGAIATSGETKIDEVNENLLGVVWVTSVGQADRAFSGDGRVLFRFPNSYIGEATDLLADGTALEVTAAVQDSAGFEQGIARLDSHGTFDTTFSGNGKTTLFQPNQTGAAGIAKQGNKLVVGTGVIDLDSVPSYRVALARLLMS